MINGISLFSNVGIGELYLKDCNINIVVANELIPDRANFYRHVYPDCNMITGDIFEHYDELVDLAKRNNCKFLMATPPCQGMSVAGRRNYEDKRNFLIIPVLDAIKDIDPDYVLIENVPQLLNLTIKYNDIVDTVMNTIEREFKDIYYINDEKIVNFKDFGVPQNRKRAIIILSKRKKYEFPLKEKEITVRQVIGDLPSVEAIVDGNVDYFEGNSKKIQECLKISKWHRPIQHAFRHVIIMRHTPTGHSAFENDFYYPKKIDGTRVKGYNTTYKRMNWDSPAPTITTANGVISSQCNVHPGRKNEDGTYSDARVLTIYEIMRLFTIPDDWNVPQWASENFSRRVIGEGVPPLFIKKIIQNLGSDFRE